MLGKLFKSFFSKPEVTVEAIKHQGYTITPILEDSGGHYYTRAKISKEIGGDIKEVTLIRADTHSSPEQAEEYSIVKAKQIIAEQGDDMFKHIQV